MEQGQLDKFRMWFDDYVAGFYGDDEYINANIKLKDDHSRRVCDETRFLAEQLELSDNQKLIADAIALLHDVGRFKQFIVYRTYNDPRSTNHCLLGLDVLREHKVLDGVETQERQWIEKAIEYHGIKKLPDGLDNETLLFCQLIRDADKIDIFYVVTQYYQQYQEEPDNFKLEVELPDEPGYSKQIAESILAGQRVDYKALQNWNDMKLLQLGWVYDVNFTAALERIKKREFLERIFDFLPATGDIKRIREKIFEYVDKRTEQC